MFKRLIYIGPTVFCLFILTFYLCVMNNSAAVIFRLTQKLGIVAFLYDDMTDDEFKNLKKDIASLNGVKSISYVNKESALTELLVQYPQMGQQISAIGTNPIPASVEIRVGVPEEQLFEDILQRLNRSPKVQDVTYPQGQLKKLQEIHRFIEHKSLLVGSMLALVIFIAVFEIMWLLFTAYKKKYDMRFVPEGIFHTVISSIISIALTYGLFMFLSRTIPGLVFMPIEQVSVVIGLGGFTGGLSGFIFSVFLAQNNMR